MHKLEKCDIVILISECTFYKDNDLILE